MNKHSHRRMQNLIRQHVIAQINLSHAGMYTIAERLVLEARAKEAKTALYGYLSLLVN